MSAQRLYKAEWVHDDVCCDVVADQPEEWWEGPEEPAGWREYALENWPDGPREGEVWPNGYKPFFWPNTDKVFRSRSAAQSRVDIINRWGGRAVLLECTPQWETVEAANKRRANARLLKRIEKKQLELMSLEALVA